jgi:hypothetical protein
MSGERDKMLAEAYRLIAAGDQKGAARVASTFVAQHVAANRHPQRGNRRTNGYWSKHEDWRPLYAREFRIGSMRKLEWIAGQRGRDEAIRFERELWLPRLKDWLAEAQQEGHEPTRFYLTSCLTTEIKRLQRCLGLKQSPEERRIKTRERVRVLRAARRATGGR